MPRQILYPVYVGQIGDIAPPAETIELDKWAQPQQLPIAHRRYQGMTQSVFAAEPADFPAEPETVTLDKWAQPQQEPAARRRFAAAATGRATGFAVETIVVAIGQSQPTIPTPHRRFNGFTPDISQPLEPTLFQAVVEEVTLDKWFQPSQEPLRHRRFQSASVIAAGIDPTLLESDSQVHWFQSQQPPVKHQHYQSSPSMVDGTEPGLLEAFTQNLAWAQPQADPQPLKGRQVWLTQFTRGYDDVEFVPPGVFDPGTGFSWPTQQAPVKHKRYASPSLTVEGIAPLLLEAFTQNIAWVQPQALPQPIKHRKPWLDQYVKGVTDDEIAPPFDVATFVFPPQELPGRHKRFQGWQGMIAGTQATLLDPFTQNISWMQPQQEPVPHRSFDGHEIYFSWVWSTDIVEAIGGPFCLDARDWWMPSVEIRFAYMPSSEQRDSRNPGSEARDNC